MYSFCVNEVHDTAGVKHVAFDARFEQIKKPSKAAAPLERSRQSFREMVRRFSPNWKRYQFMGIMLLVKFFVNKKLGNL